MYLALLFLDPYLIAHPSYFQSTFHFWKSWIGKSTYKGRWREVVHRQALTLKMMIFEETGAIIVCFFLSHSNLWKNLIQFVSLGGAHLLFTRRDRWGTELGL